MPRGIGVFGAKRRTKRVDFGQGTGERFSFELAAHREVGLSRKKIFRVVDLALFSRRIFEVDGGDAKQLPCSFAIASGDDRRVDVNETALLKKIVDSKGEPAAHAEDRPEKIRTRPEVRNLAKKFRGVSLLLERIGIIGRAYDVDLAGHEFPALTFSGRRSQFTAHNNRSASR